MAKCQKIKNILNQNFHDDPKFALAPSNVEIMFDADLISSLPFTIWILQKNNFNSH